MTKQVSNTTGTLRSLLKSFVWTWLGVSCLLIGISSHASAQSIQWETNLGGSDVDKGWSIIQTTDGGFAMAGQSGSDNGDVGGNNGGYDYWLVKLNNAGTIQWENNFGGSDNDYAKSIIQTADGGFAIAGRSSSQDGDVGGNNGADDYWFAKLDSSGTIEWENNFGGSDDDEAESIVQTDDGGFAIAGTSESSDGDVGSNNGFGDYWVVKLDSSGALEWDNNLGGSEDDRANSIVQTNDGGFAIAGRSESSDGDVSGNNGKRDYWIAKLNNAGTLQWDNNLGGSNDDEARSIVQTTDGGFAIAGESESMDGNVGGNKGFDDYWVVKLNNTGTIQWENNLGGSVGDDPHSIVQTADGGFAIAGTSFSKDGDIVASYANDDYWVVKLNNSGAIQWGKILGGNDFDRGYSIVQTADGGFAVAGESNSSDEDVGGNNGFDDAWVVKLNSVQGCSPATATIDTNACEVYKAPSGNATYTQSGTYQDTLANASVNGCDSIITINLTVNNHTTSTINPSVCNEYEVPSGHATYTQSGTYQDTLANASVNNCDSIITINLTIDTVDSSVTKTGATLEANATGATYQWLDCNNGYAPISGATNRSFTTSSNGNYAVKVVNNGCSDTSACTSVTGVGIEERSASSIRIRPNPAADKISIDHSSQFNIDQYSIHTLTGRLVKSGKLTGKGTNTLDVSHLSPGVYLLEVQGEEAVLRKKVVVE